MYDFSSETAFVSLRNFKRRNVYFFIRAIDFFDLSCRSTVLDAVDLSTEAVEVFQELLISTEIDCVLQ